MASTATVGSRTGDVWSACETEGGGGEEGGEMGD